MRIALLSQLPTDTIPSAAIAGDEKMESSVGCSH